MLQPIYQQRVLPAQVTSQYLPAITADTTEIHKKIAQMYNRTIVMPPTHSVEVTNYVQTPQGILVQDPIPQVNTPLIQSSQVVSVDPSPVIPATSIVQAVPVVPISQVIPVTPVNPNVSIIQPVIIPQFQQAIIHPESSLPTTQQMLIHSNIKIFQPVMPNSMIGQSSNSQINGPQPLINQSILAQPLSASLNTSIVRPII